MYGENYDRLVRLKQLVDPTNLFKHCLWPSSDEKHNTPLELLYAEGAAAAAAAAAAAVDDKEDSRLGADGVAALSNGDKNEAEDGERS